MQFNVCQKKMQLLIQAFKRLNIKETDIKETFARGSGAGGQKINKTSVKVELLHLPTNIRVSCSKTRSQLLNRYYARKILIEKIDVLINGNQAEKKLELARIKKNKARAAKKKLLKSQRNSLEKLNI